MWGTNEKTLGSKFARRGVPTNRGHHELDAEGWQHFLSSRCISVPAPVRQKRKRTNKAVEPPKEEIPVINSVATDGGKGGSTGEINFAGVTLEAAAAMIAALGATDKAMYDVKIVWD